ncbi:hypothetical protein BWQ96_07872 [Gracilariopsis chorda]|uniref:Uncharacterized protein n=1 Tax=Gracilariopsis chorda TaxID=448386 RepID=A0A2V3IJV0_9FLOR|nr:hypothetical protein BWQ96_07872 [Gracilariopsis chorda]|eukprot:PXF42352.1 hypothetical protein BWQ96_07872 [Gracilariopsis chorda]
MACKSRSGVDAKNPGKSPLDARTAAKPEV